MKVAHLFHAYLYTRQNWCYQMISHLVEVDIDVVTDTLVERGQFPLPAARFVTPLYTQEMTVDSPLLLRCLKFVLQRFWLHLLLPGRLKHVELLHAHFSVMGWQYLALRRKLAVPLIISFYGYDYEWLPRNHPEWQERYPILFREAALFLTEGNAGRDKLIRMGCPAEKVRVARLGVNVRKIPFVLRAKGPTSLRLVQVASFAEKKGHTTTLKAFARASKECSGLHLTLVGGDAGGLRAEMDQIIAEHGIADRVEFVNGIDFANLYDYLRGFHVFIHPSRYARSGDCEGGAPIVLLDAQATGMPVLSTRHCDIPDEVVHGVTGLLVAEDDEEGLADAIVRFCRMDDGEYHRFCTNARRHVEENYDVVRCAQVLREIYADIIEKV